MNRDLSQLAHLRLKAKSIEINRDDAKSELLTLDPKTIIKLIEYQNEHQTYGQTVDYIDPKKAADILPPSRIRTGCETYCDTYFSFNRVLYEGIIFDRNFILISRRHGGPFKRYIEISYKTVCPNGILGKKNLL